MSESILFMKPGERSITFHGLVGTSRELERFVSKITRPAQTDIAVLIDGEVGSCKALTARSVPKESKYRSQA